MPFQEPSSKPQPDSAARRKPSTAVSSLVQAEKMMQIAFMLPCCMLIGWGAGWWLDHHFGMHWATIVGLILGLIAGMVSVVRLVMAAGSAAERQK